MINILYIVQQSVYNNEGKWVTADSNVQMMAGFVKEVLRITDDFTFHIVIGALNDFKDINSYSELVDHPNAVFYGYDFPVDAFLNRQHFSIFDFERLMNELPEIDIIWNNITEASRNIKTWMYYRKYPAKLISSCYWLDCPLIGEEKVPFDVAYMWRQFDGFLCSDLVTFTCESVKKAFIENASKAFNSKFVYDVINKSVIFDFGFNAHELNIAYTPQLLEKPIILFLNRMSGINYTHHEEFIEAIKILSKQRNDFSVVFTNPSKKIDSLWLRKEVPNYLNWRNKDTQVLTKSEYAELLHEGAISVHLFEIERYGGCAHREAIYCDNLPINLEIYEYERIQGPDYPFYIKSIEPQEITRVLNKALNNLDYVHTFEFQEQIQRRNFQSSYEHQSEQIIKTLRRLTNADNE